jgi:pyocin large subunit-like protein
MLSVSIVVIVGFFCAREAPEPQTPTREKREAAAVSSHPGIGFASHDKFVEHFRKHGREFGSITMEAYLHLAQELRDRPAGGSILEEVRKDGVTTRFDRETGAFIAFNPDRTIRTFFRPNDGEAYFHRQSKRQQND